MNICISDFVNFLILGFCKMTLHFRVSLVNFLHFGVSPMNFRVVGEFLHFLVSWMNVCALRFHRRIFAVWGFTNDFSHFKVSLVNFGDLILSLGFRWWIFALQRLSKWIFVFGVFSNEFLKFRAHKLIFAFLGFANEFS